MRRAVLVLALTVLGASAADARPIAMYDVVKSALDAVCEKVVTGGLRNDAIHDGFTRGWTDAGGGALAKSGHWGLVRVTVTADNLGKAQACRVTGVGEGGVESLSYADAWGDQNGFVREGERQAESGRVRQAWTAHGGRVSMRASAAEGKARPNVEVVVARRG